MLGPKPSLALRGALSGGVVSLASAKLDGAAASASGAGVISSDKLALNIDWSAQGPFRAGALPQRRLRNPNAYASIRPASPGPTGSKRA